jgi:hypothetical protein
VAQYALAILQAIITLQLEFIQIQILAILATDFAQLAQVILELIAILVFLESQI